MIFPLSPALITLSISVVAHPEIAMKLSTVEEANALLPELRRSWADIGRQRDVMSRLAPEIKQAGEREKTVAQALASATSLRCSRSLRRALRSKTSSAAFSDFPHLRDGCLVFLWQQGEDRIQWWQELESGFAGRQPP